MYMSTKSIKIFSGTSNPGLSHEICKYLNVPLSHVTIGRFPDGEISVQIQESIRGDDVFIIQPTNSPANDNLMELLILIDAARRASAGRITAVIPFFMGINITLDHRNRNGVFLLRLNGIHFDPAKSEISA